MKELRFELKYTHSDGFDASDCDGVIHKKVLPWLSVVQSVTGSYDIRLASGETHSTGEGGFFIAPAGVQQTITHNVSKDSGKMECRWLFIDAIVDGTHSIDSLWELPTVLPDEYRAQMNRLFDEIFNSSDPITRIAHYCGVISLLGSIARVRSTHESNVAAKVAKYIKDNHAHRLTVTQLAGVANMSASNLHAIFKQSMGTSPMAYLMQFRLSLAAEMLCGTHLTVAEIAESVGMYDQFYFSKCFKKSYGVSPLQYRKERHAAQ